MHIIGIDPGIVDSGAVSMQFDKRARVLDIDWLVVQNANSASGPEFIAEWIEHYGGKPSVFVEKYNPRPGMPTNAKMVELEHSLKLALPKGAAFINNMGVKQVITRELMMLLNVWTYTHVTHHQDLRAAARIGLYGAVKDDELNEGIADVVHADRFGTAWTIRSTGGGRVVEARVV